MPTCLYPPLLIKKSVSFLVVASDAAIAGCSISAKIRKYMHQYTAMLVVAWSLTTLGHNEMVVGLSNGFKE